MKININQLNHIKCDNQFIELYYNNVFIGHFHMLNNNIPIIYKNKLNIKILPQYFYLAYEKIKNKINFDHVSFIEKKPLLSNIIQCIQEEYSISHYYNKYMCGNKIIIKIQYFDFLYKSLIENIDSYINEYDLLFILNLINNMLIIPDNQFDLIKNSSIKKYTY